MFSKNNLIRLCLHIVSLFIVNIATLAFVVLTGGLEENIILTIVGYEFHEFMIMVTINLIPLAWLIAAIICIWHEAYLEKRENSIHIEGKKVVVSTKKRKRKKVYSEENFSIKMQVSKLNMMYGVTVYDDELEDEENDYCIKLISPTKINGEQVSLNLEDEKLYQHLKLGQVLDVDLTVTLDKRGNEIDRRFEFVL